MRGRATHDDTELAREAGPRTLRRLSTLQPYVPGRGTLAITPAPSPADCSPARDLAVLPVEPRTVADLCERIACAGDAPAAARLVIESLPDVLRVEHLRLSLDAPELTLDVRLSRSEGTTSRRCEGGACGARSLWLISSLVPRQIQTAQAPVEAGGAQFGQVRIERAAESFDAEEREALRIVAIALGQRLATLAALEQVAALSARWPDGERGRCERADGGNARWTTSERISPRDLPWPLGAVLDDGGVELGPYEQTREGGNDAANRRGG